MPAVLAAAAVVGYLVGLLIRQWDADSSPWTVAVQVTVAALVSLAAVRRNIRQVEFLKADPRGYVQDRRLAEDNRLLPGWLLAGNLLIAGVFAAVLLLKPRQGDGYLVEGVLLLTEVVLWGVLLWGWLAVRREVESTGQVELVSTGQGTELQAVSFPLDRFANNAAGRGGHALVVLLDAVADHAAALPGPPVRHTPPATG